jgi:HEAT repeat protein
VRKSVLFLPLAAMAAANAAYFLLQSDWSEPEAQPAPAAAAPAVPPPLETLGHGARMPTPEELEEEARYDEARVTEADTRLHSSQAEERVAGAEQLSAYPTPEAEQILGNALALDFDPEVRRTAAQSLSAFKKPAEKTVAALLAALEDESEAVQVGALDTLLGVAGKYENNSPQLKKLLAGLATQAASRRAKARTRRAVLAFLKDQEPPAAGR